MRCGRHDQDLSRQQGSFGFRVQDIGFVVSGVWVLGFRVWGIKVFRAHKLEGLIAFLNLEPDVNGRRRSCRLYQGVRENRFMAASFQASRQAG